MTLQSIGIWMVLVEILKHMAGTVDVFVMVCISAVVMAAGEYFEYKNKGKKK